MADKYDKQIARILAADNFARAIKDHWERGVGLFQLAVRPSPRIFPLAGVAPTCGCLTQIRFSLAKYRAATPELTEAIWDDRRIPTSYSEIRPEHLPIFAYWQRRIDAELGEA